MKFPKIALLFIIATILFHMLANVYILKQSKIVRAYDEGGYIWLGIRLNQDFMNKPLKEIAAGHVNRGAVLYIESLMITILNKFGLTDINLVVVYTNIFFLCILLMSTFKIGSILFSKEVGLVSSVLLSFSPQIFSHTRMGFIDFPLAAMISLSFLCLLKSDYFRSVFFSLLTAVFFVLAEFTKESAIIFILPVLTYYFIKSQPIKNDRKIRNLNFLIICLFLLFRLAAVYLPQHQFYLHYSLWKIFYKFNQFDYFYYFKCLPIYYCGLIISVALVPAMLSYLFNIKKRNMFLLVWLLGPFLICSISPNRTSRFLIPALSPLFLLLVAEIFSKTFKIRRIYLIILIISAIAQFAMFVFLPSLLLPKDPRNPVNNPTRLFSIEKEKDYYKVEKLLNIFINEKITLGKNYIVVSTFYSFHDALNCELGIRRMPFYIDCPQSYDMASLLLNQGAKLEEKILTADYVLDTTGDLGNGSTSEDIGGSLKKAYKTNSHKFKKIGGFKIEDDKYIYVYRNIKLHD